MQKKRQKQQIIEKQKQHLSKREQEIQAKMQQNRAQMEGRIENELVKKQENERIV